MLARAARLAAMSAPASAALAPASTAAASAAFATSAGSDSKPQPTFKRELAGELEQVVENIATHLKSEGFGVLTRIDLHQKVKEKLGKEMAPCVILGACNPMMAYEAFQISSDVTSRMPCNITVRQLSKGLMSVEVAKPSAAMLTFDNPMLTKMSEEGDQKLLRVLDRLEGKAAGI